jgi:hypothetical protein
MCHAVVTRDPNYRKGIEKHELGTGFLCIRESYFPCKTVEFVIDRMSYIILRGHWCHIIVSKIHAPTEDKIDDGKDSVNEELERLFNKFSKYHMKILLGEFSAKVGKVDIFKPTIGNESLHEISNDNGSSSKLCHI